MKGVNETEGALLKGEALFFCGERLYDGREAVLRERGCITRRACVTGERLYYAEGL